MCNDAYIPEFGDDRELQEQMYQEAMYELEARKEQDYQEYLEVLASGDCTQ